MDLQLRGVCLDSPVEKFYVLHNSTELHGHGGSLFSWDDGEKTWRITSNSQSLARLQSARGERELPLGLNQWEFTHSGCSDPGNQPRQTCSVFFLMSSYERNRIIIDKVDHHPPSTLTLLTPRQDKFVPRGSYIALNIHFV